jgi:hypothetical protein
MTGSLVLIARSHYQLHFQMRNAHLSRLSEGNTVPAGWNHPITLCSGSVSRIANIYVNCIHFPQFIYSQSLIS